MAYFALLWKARTIEKYRTNYEKEKLNSIMLSNAEIPNKTLVQKFRHYRYDTKRRAGKLFRRWFPEGSPFSNFLIYLKTDQTFPNFIWKSIFGFVGGIVLTYLWFMFFVFQLSISLVHATIMSSIIGVLLTLGLAFSYRIRCLVFLLIPQFFSKIGRYTLTCYALVLILTGPATNTLRNSEVLSESMACGQEQVKTSVKQITESIKKPFNSMKDTIKTMIDKVKEVALNLKDTLLKLHRLVMSIVRVFQSAFSWLSSIVGICNKKVGTPYVRCTRALNDGVLDCQARLGPYFSWLCNVVYVAHVACWAVRPLDVICVLVEFVSGTIVATIKRKLRTFSNHVKTMLYVSVHVHHSYSFSSNSSKSASQVAAGIVTEIRHRAEPLLTWLSWSSCVTSLFLLLIIFRAKYYQHMYATRSRYDNRYVTKELRDLDLKRVRENRDTVLPLNRRERAKYVTTTSFRLVASEKLYLARSVVFMGITTFKLLIHMVADYSLYWVLMTIRYHGRFQSPQFPGVPDAGVVVTGDGPVAGMIRSLVESLSIPLASPVPSPATCLPDPYPPDMQRYTQIGVLIFLLWFFALFEPYGLRLRHVIMGHYRPERAKARAVWLYNHILRTRGGFLKLARRKLHRDYKYATEERFTFRQWLDAHIPCMWLRSLLGTSPKEPHCLLCGTTEHDNDPDTQLIRCETPNCPGIFCASCFNDIGQLCTICLSPVDYGDISDVSLEKGSSDDSSGDEDIADSENTDVEQNDIEQPSETSSTSEDSDDSEPKHKENENKRKFTPKKGKKHGQEDAENDLDCNNCIDYNIQSNVINYYQPQQQKCLLSDDSSDNFSNLFPMTKRNDDNEELIPRKTFKTIRKTDTKVPKDLIKGISKLLKCSMDVAKAIMESSFYKIEKTSKELTVFKVAGKTGLIKRYQMKRKPISRYKKEDIFFRKIKKYVYKGDMKELDNVITKWQNNNNNTIKAYPCNIENNSSAINNKEELKSKITENGDEKESTSGSQLRNTKLETSNDIEKEKHTKSFSRKLKAPFNIIRFLSKNKLNNNDLHTYNNTHEDNPNHLLRFRARNSETKRKWITEQYNREVGIKPGNKAKVAELFKETEEELKVMSGGRKMKIKVFQPHKHSDFGHRFVWHNAPRPKRCTCPVTSCSCLGQYNQNTDTNDVVPYKINPNSGLVRNLWHFFGWEKPSPPPAGTFLPELDSALNSQLQKYNQMAEEGILINNGPEDCLSRCPHFYRTEDEEGDNDFHSYNNNIENDDDYREVKQAKSENITKKTSQQGYQRIDESSFQDLNENDPLSDGVTPVGASQSNVFAEGDSKANKSDEKAFSRTPIKDIGDSIYKDIDGKKLRLTSLSETTFQYGSFIKLKMGPFHCLKKKISRVTGNIMDMLFGGSCSEAGSEKEVEVSPVVKTRSCQWTNTNDNESKYEENKHSSCKCLQDAEAETIPYTSNCATQYTNISSNNVTTLYENTLSRIVSPSSVNSSRSTITNCIRSENDLLSQIYEDVGLTNLPTLMINIPMSATSSEADEPIRKREKSKNNRVKIDYISEKKQSKRGRKRFKVKRIDESTTTANDVYQEIALSDWWSPISDHRSNIPNINLEKKVGDHSIEPQKIHIKKKKSKIKQNKILSPYISNERKVISFQGEALTISGTQFFLN